MKRWPLILIFTAALSGVASFIVLAIATVFVGDTPLPLRPPSRTDTETKALVRDAAERTIISSLRERGEWRFECLLVRREQIGENRWKAMGSVWPISYGTGLRAKRWEAVCEDRPWGMEVIVATIDDKKVAGD